MLRFILVALTVVLFLILSIPLLLILRVVDHYDTKRRQRICSLIPRFRASWTIRRALLSSMRGRRSQRS